MLAPPRTRATAVVFVNFPGSSWTLPFRSSLGTAQRSVLTDRSYPCTLLERWNSLGTASFRRAREPRPRTCLGSDTSSWASSGGEPERNVRSPSKQPGARRPVKLTPSHGATNGSPKACSAARSSEPGRRFVSITRWDDRIRPPARNFRLDGRGLSDALATREGCSGLTSHGRERSRPRPSLGQRRAIQRTYSESPSRPAPRKVFPSSETSSTLENSTTSPTSMPAVVRRSSTASWLPSLSQRAAWLS